MWYFKARCSLFLIEHSYTVAETALRYLHPIIPIVQNIEQGTRNGEE